MKILLVIALFGAVQAKPDPWFYHGLPHVPLVYTHPLVKAAPAAPCKNEAGVEVPCALGWYHIGAPAAEAPAVVDERKKREAEAEPEAEAEADPWVYYSGYYGHPGYYGYGYGLGYGWGGYYGHGYYGYGGCRNNAGALVPCALG